MPRPGMAFTKLVGGSIESDIISQTTQDPMTNDFSRESGIGGSVTETQTEKPLEKHWWPEK